MPSPDVVYVCREDERNDELRHSLRSLANLPHGTVWIAGYKPTWATGVEYLATRQTRSKHINSTQNLLTACAQPDVSERFYLFNDDFFVLEPIDEVPALHRGTVAEVVADYRDRLGGISPAMPYRRGMVETARLLNRWGIDDPLSYELHVPMLMDKATAADAIKRAYVDNPYIPALHKRTLYGNVARVGGEQIADVKVTDNDTIWDEGQTFVSTGDSAFRSGEVGRRLRQTFGEPSPYET